MSPEVWHRVRSALDECPVTPPDDPLADNIVILEPWNSDQDDYYTGKRISVTRHRGTPRQKVMVGVVVNYFGASRTAYVAWETR